MSGSKEETVIRKLLDSADIKINGDRPWDIQVLNSGFYQRVLSGGSLAFGESYMDGWWECPALDRMFTRLFENRVHEKAGTVIKSAPWAGLKALVLNAQSRAKAFVVGKRHYDIGNDLFLAMLDRDMNYSCAYWCDAATLEDAQRAKVELICRKIGLKPGMRVLDIGCGWGGFIKHAACEHGARILGVTVSREQAEYVKAECCEPDVRVELMDYRDLNGAFDAVVSVGMFEHVGHKNYRTYMRTVHRCLKPKGLFLLQTIGGNRSTKSLDPWVEKYIFPNSMLPSARQITEAAEGLLILEDWQSFGHYYDKTLMAWYHNFIANWARLKANYSKRFYRMWTYYLLSCAGGFRAKMNQLWQIVFSNEGIEGVFRNSDHFFVSE